MAETILLAAIHYEGLTASQLSKLKAGSLIATSKLASVTLKLREKRIPRQKLKIEERVTISDFGFTGVIRQLQGRQPR
jgi:hypothetical protein